MPEISQTTFLYFCSLFHIDSTLTWSFPWPQDDPVKNGKKQCRQVHPCFRTLLCTERQLANSRSLHRVSKYWCSDYLKHKFWKIWVRHLWSFHEASNFSGKILLTHLIHSWSAPNVEFTSARLSIHLSICPASVTSALSVLGFLARRLILKGNKSTTQST